MRAMIQNDSQKSWMAPLLEFRNDLDFRGDTQRERELERRDYRRLSGRPQLKRAGDELVPGPYTQKARAWWLERLLRTQVAIATNPNTPEAFRRIQLVTRDELSHIRRIWVEDKHEIEDLVPAIYEEIIGAPYPDKGEEAPILDQDALQLLEQAASGDRLHYETLRNLLHIEHQHRAGTALIAKRGLIDQLTSEIETGYFADAADALAWAQRHQAGKTVRVEDADHSGSPLTDAASARPQQPPLDF